MRPHQKKKDQKTSKCHTTAQEGGKDNVQPHTGRHHLHTCTDNVVQTSEAKDGLSSFLEAVFGDWRRVTVGTLVRPRPLRRAKQNHQPIYTFAKHSFIINKSPFFFV